MDRPRQPEPLECGYCGQLQEWVWAMQLSGMGWCRPNSHKACAARAKAEERRKLTDLAVRKAQVPVKLRPWSWGRMEVQPSDMPEWAFMRSLAMKPHTIGVLTRNAEAVHRVATWKPASGWLYIEGTQGVGKSTLSAALVRSLVEPPQEDRWVTPEGEPWVMGVHSMRPGYRRKVLPQRWPAQYCDWPELDRRISLSWSRDKEPLAQVAKVRVLVLDDLPAKTSEAKRDAIERLLCARYRDQLPTVITSNVPYHDVIDEDVPAFGHRVADRLAEVCTPVSIGGHSWRKPPERPKEKRKPGPDRKTRAAEPEQSALF